MCIRDSIHSFQTKLSEEDDAELNDSTQFSVVDKQGLEDAYSCVIEQTNPTLNPVSYTHLIVYQFITLCLVQIWLFYNQSIILWGVLYAQ